MVPGAAAGAVRREPTLGRRRDPPSRVRPARRGAVAGGRARVEPVGPLLAALLVLVLPAPATAQAWDARVEEVRRITDGILATVEEMPGPEGSPEARDRWDRFSRAVALEAARSWAVLARFGFDPPPADGLDWRGGRGVEERFVRRLGPWERSELRVLASLAFRDLVAHMEGLDDPGRRRVDPRTGRTQGEWLAGLAPTFAAKLTVLEDWVRRSRAR